MYSRASAKAVIVFGADLRPKERLRRRIISLARLLPGDLCSPHVQVLPCMHFILILANMEPTPDFQIPCTTSLTFVCDIEESSGEVPSYPSFLRGMIFLASFSSQPLICLYALGTGSDAKDSIMLSSLSSLSINCWSMVGWAFTDGMFALAHSLSLDQFWTHFWVLLLYIEQRFGLGGVFYDQASIIKWGVYCS